MGRNEEGGLRPWKWNTFTFRVSRRWYEDHGWNTRIPYRFGWATYDFDTDCRRYVLLPFNLVWATVWWLSYRVGYAWPKAIDSHIAGKLRQKAYDRGWNDALNQRNTPEQGERNVPSSNR